jgi:tRNA threonylcarbamoyladenosine biosynthesis protein TsaB
MGDAWLLIETSARAGRLGLARGDGVVGRFDLDPARRHARDLAAGVERLLADAGLTARGLAGVMVGVGPGGYTGLRVGLASAKALAYAVGCPLVAVPTFHAIAEQAPSEVASLLVVADALQGLAYVQRFARRDGVWMPADELRIALAADWLPWAAGDVWLSGPGLVAHSSLVPCHARVVPESDREPRVEGLLRAGRRLTPVTREELFRLEPLYLRGSSAEEKAKSSVGSGLAGA